MYALNLVIIANATAKPKNQTKCSKKTTFKFY